MVYSKNQLYFTQSSGYFEPDSKPPISAFWRAQVTGVFGLSCCVFLSRSKISLTRPQSWPAINFEHNQTNVQLESVGYLFYVALLGCSMTKRIKIASNSNSNANFSKGSSDVSWALLCWLVIGWTWSFKHNYNSIVCYTRLCAPLLHLELQFCSPPNPIDRNSSTLNQFFSLVSMLAFAWATMRHLIALEWHTRVSRSEIRMQKGQPATINLAQLKSLEESLLIHITFGFGLGFGFGFWPVAFHGVGFVWPGAALRLNP